jgi:hypothetical protein
MGTRVEFKELDRLPDVPLKRKLADHVLMRSCGEVKDHIEIPNPGVGARQRDDRMVLVNRLGEEMLANEA